MSECLLFSMDTYYKDLTEEQQKNISEYNFDHPDALDFELLNKHLNSLMNWESINICQHMILLQAQEEKKL